MINWDRSTPDLVVTGSARCGAVDSVAGLMYSDYMFSS